ncbi:hypothetical protein C8Q76DRAFT_189084 [Earliella scabrosa]|nr:hypothetical protein C8Q76DRAFT_189084 [Earliella scabrosa]
MREKSMADPHLQLLRPHGSTIRSFKYIGPYSEPDENYYKLLSSLAGAMESLEKLNIWAFRTRRSSHTPPIVLSRDHFPRLHTLSLYGVHFSWTSSLYSSLRSLSLKACWTSIPIPDLRRILESSPALESLELCGCLPGEVDEDTYPVPCIALSRLRCLTLYGTLPVTSYLCDSITTPSVESIKVSRTVKMETVDPVAELAPIQRVYQPFLRRVKRVTMNLPVNGYIDIGFNGDPDEPYENHPMFVEVANGPCAQVSPAAWNAVIDAVHNAHSQLTSLNVNYQGLEDIDKEMWRRCFSHFPLLEHLNVGSWEADVAPNAFDVLFDTLGSNVESGGACELYCPKLRRLVVNGMLLDEHAVAALVSLLQFRASNGLPLQQLIFKQTVCPLKTEDARALRARLEVLVPVTIMYANWNENSTFEDLFDVHIDFLTDRDKLRRVA